MSSRLIFYKVVYFIPYTVSSVYKQIFSDWFVDAWFIEGDIFYLSSVMNMN